VPVRYAFVAHDDATSTTSTRRRCLRLLADDFMESGDLEERDGPAAARRLQPDAEGERIEGLREPSGAHAREAPQLEQQGDPDGELQRYRDWLEDIEPWEGNELESLLAEARSPADERRREVTRDLVESKFMQRTS